ncbi:MAG: LytTR family DNA-binding domain-containing protein [Pseudomonadota bacterium]
MREPNQPYGSPDWDRDVSVSLVVGSAIRLSPYELWRIFREPSVIAMICLSVVLMSLMNPVLFPGMPSPVSRLVHWAAASVVYVAFLPYWFAYFSKLWRRFTDRPVSHWISTVLFISVVGLVATGPTLAANAFVEANATGLSPLGRLINIGVTLCLETAGAIWLLPLLQFKYAQEARDAVEAETLEDQRTVLVAGQRFSLKSIQRARSMEHFLVITMDGEEHVLRARLRDFLAQVGDDDGIQPHRSHWIATSAIKEIGEAAIVTKSGDNIPIARGRAAEVAAWQSTNIARTQRSVDPSERSFTEA